MTRSWFAGLRKEKETMRNTFVATENFQRLCAGLQALEARGAREACLMVVDGKPGLGKTAATARIAAQSDAVCVRAKRNWKPNSMLKELLQALQVQPAWSFDARFSQALEALSQREAQAQANEESFFVILDEVDRLTRSELMLSTLRDLSDMLEIPFVLVGMGEVRGNLKRFPQVTSRVAQYVEFLPFTPGDTRLLMEGLSEYPLADDLIEEVHRLSKGYSREIKEALAHIERFAARQGNGTPITLADMTGQVIMNNRATSQPIVARG